MIDPTPTYVYLEITHKVRAEHVYGSQEMQMDFARLYHALKLALRENSTLNHDLNQAYRAVTDLEIKNISLEMENLTLRSSLEDPNTPGNPPETK